MENVSYTEIGMEMNLLRKDVSKERKEEVGGEKGRYLKKKKKRLHSMRKKERKNERKKERKKERKSEFNKEVRRRKKERKKERKKI